jgi:hypothetical protein
MQSVPPPAPISRPPESLDDGRATLIHAKPLAAVTAPRHIAVRVMVQQVEGEPGVFIARPMRSGDRVAAGSTEALLVALSPGMDPLPNQ